MGEGRPWGKERKHCSFTEAAMGFNLKDGRRIPNFTEKGEKLWQSVNSSWLGKLALSSYWRGGNGAPLTTKVRMRSFFCCKEEKRGVGKDCLLLPCNEGGAGSGTPERASLSKRHSFLTGKGGERKRW